MVSRSRSVNQPLLVRLVAFVTVFAVFSGIIGPRLIGTAAFYADGFGWYGGVGKALLFAVIAFVLLVYRTKPPAPWPVWRRQNVVWLMAAAMTFAGAWLAVGHLLHGERTLAWLAAAHGLLLASVALGLVGCLGLPTLALCGRTYRRQLAVAGVSGLAFYLLLLAFYALWPVLSAAVLRAVAWLLRLSGLEVALVPPRTLLLTKFGITIAQACSGIESLALFSGLYGVVSFLDWRRFNLRRLVLVFPIALVALFICNILRVYTLVLAGYYIDPTLAFSLFHTYAGMVFFMLYSLAFWALAYRHLLQKS